MRYTLAELDARGHANNFNLIRLIAAWLVVFSHAFVLLGLPEPGTSQVGMNLGNLAVDIFFLTSGFLVTKSLLVRRDLLSFIAARAFRIYPGLIVMTILTVGAAALFGAPGMLHDPETAAFALRHALPWLPDMTHNVLPGIFGAGSELHEFNGPLWSLPYELRMYFMLAVLSLIAVALGLRPNRFVELAVFGVAAGALLTLICLGRVPALRSLATPQIYNMAKLGFMFFVGAAYYVARRRIVIDGRVAWGMLAALILSMFSRHAFPLVYPLCIGYLLFAAAYLVEAWRPAQDHSYGTYIYGWPVQQAVIVLTHTTNPAVVFVLTAPIVAALAGLSWNLVEKPAQAWKRFVVRSAAPKPALRSSSNS